MHRVRYGLLAKLSLALTLTIGACATTDPGPVLLPGNVNAPPPTIEIAGDVLLTDTTWRWLGTLLPDGSSVVPDAPERYAIEFKPGGKLNVLADCNRGSASYLLNGAQLSFGPIAMTKMACQRPSHDAEFLKQLSSVASQSFQGDNLVLTLASQRGTMRFATTRQ